MITVEEFKTEIKKLGFAYVGKLVNESYDGDIFTIQTKKHGHKFIIIRSNGVVTCDNKNLNIEEYSPLEIGWSLAKTILS